MLFADTIIEVGPNLTTIVTLFVSLLTTLISGLMIRKRVIRKRNRSEFPPDDDLNTTLDDRPSRRKRKSFHDDQHY